ncbi:unnamed protein product [Nyctereutes procyonoides]|uniref:(raccoon dog) hypothetical protein n=1 Tax=Nyctereutes procyonoides TaxID=34880 RepID=A0A811ZSY5_NYCPR|nr:unnamed protein product [Nyctereutes procyonoides]
MEEMYFRWWRSLRCEQSWKEPEAAEDTGDEVEISGSSFAAASFALARGSFQPCRVSFWSQAVVQKRVRTLSRIVRWKEQLMRRCHPRRSLCVSRPLVHWVLLGPLS